MGQAAFGIACGSALREAACKLVRYRYSLRVIGDPNLPVSDFARGGHGLAQNVAAMQTADAILVSEAREYDSFEYVRDTVLSGQKKGAIFTSHQTGEDEGMRYFAEWSKPFLPEVPVKYIATTDEYWTV